MDVSPTNLLQEERIQETPILDATAQLEIGGEEEDKEDFMEEDLLEDKEKDMLEDKLCEHHKVNSHYKKLAIFLMFGKTCICFFSNEILITVDVL